MRILLIDDNEDILECIGPCFESRGFEITTVLGAKAGAQAIKGQQYDIIVSDREMPDFSGLHLAQLKKDLGIKKPFILYTGAPDLSQSEMDRLDISAVYDKTDILNLLEDLNGLRAS